MLLYLHIYGCFRTALKSERIKIKPFSVTRKGCSRSRPLSAWIRFDLAAWILIRIETKKDLNTGYRTDRLRRLVPGTQHPYFRSALFINRFGSPPPRFKIFENLLNTDLSIPYGLYRNINVFLIRAHIVYSMWIQILDFRWVQIWTKTVPIVKTRVVKSEPQLCRNRI
jgi:hypothetical protein